MKLEIRTEGIEFAVSREPLPKLDNEGRQKADRETGELLNTTELVAMDDSGAEVIKVTTAGLPKVVKRQAVTIRGLVANPWNVDGRGWVAFRADSRCPRSPPSCSNYVARSTPPGPVGEVFTNAAGGPLQRTLFRSRVWRPALVRAGLLGAARVRGRAGQRPADGDGARASLHHTGSVHSPVAGSGQQGPRRVR